MLFISCVCFTNAQEVLFKKENFPGREQGFNKALQAYQNGDNYLGKPTPNFYLAKLEYMKAYDFNPSLALLNYQLGICYLNTSEKFLAKFYFQNAYSLNKNVHPKINFYFASFYQLESIWETALVYYNLYEQSLVQNSGSEEWKLVEKRKQECNNGIKLSAQISNVNIKNLGASVNTKYPEYTPYITTDESKIFFTSRRTTTTGNEIDVNDGMYFEDIYISTKLNNEWQLATNAGANINTKLHDAVCGIFPDGHTLILFKGAVNDGDLYYVKYENGIWSKPVGFGSNINTEYHESSACLSSDGKKLFFVSDKPGGIGGRDIYESSYDANKREWGVAKNLGAIVNTVYDEEGVFLHPDGKTLFFASNGPLTIGGYDILKSMKENDQWVLPVNLGIPINTPDDDVFVSVSANGRNIYFSSYRKEGFGEKDIYVASMQDSTIQSPNMVLLTGEVVEEVTGNPIPAKIDVVDLGNNEKVGTYDNDKETGKYVIPLPGGTKYGTVVYAEGYIFESENVEVSDTATYAEVIRHTRLKKIESGNSTRLNNIFFETGKATILPTSLNEIERIADFMNNNKKIKIEIQGHTDNVGDENKNNVLSTQRAEAVYNELIKRNIAAQRLSSKGYGETKPAADNNTDKGRSLNRRIEFVIVEN